MQLSGSITLNGIKANHAKSYLETDATMAKKMAPLILGPQADDLQEKLRQSKLGKGKDPERIDAANEAYMNIMSPLLWIITRGPLKFWKQVAKLEPEHYAMIIGSDDNPAQWCMQVELIRQLFPKVKHKGTTYLGPREYMRGMSFGEYLTAQARYSEYMQSKKLEDLAQFFGILYRPERTDVSKDSEAYADDARTPFIASRIQKEAKVFETFDKDTMLVSVLYWQGCHARMRKQYYHIFKGTSSKKSDPGEVVVNLAKSPGKQDVKDITDAPVHNILRKLNSMAKPNK
jgi:hypothetical protein